MKNLFVSLLAVFLLIGVANALTIVITPTSPSNNATLNCSINVTDVNNATFTVNASWYRNNVKLPEYDVTNSSYINATIWVTQLILNQSISMQGVNWSCSAIADNGIETFAANRTTTLEAAKIATISQSQFNSTAIKSGGNTLFGIIDEFSISNPFSSDTEFHISSVLYASSSSTKVVEYDIFDNTNNIQLGSTERTMTTNLDGAISIEGIEHTITGLATQSYLTRQRQTVGSSNTLTANNQTTLSEGMRDLATGLEINHTEINLNGTTSSTNFVLLDSVLWTPTDMGFLYMDAMDIEIEGIGFGEYIISLNGFNSSTMKRNISSIGSSGIFILNPTVYIPTEGSVNISLYARTNGDTINFSIKNAVPKIFQTHEISSNNLQGNSFSATSFTQIANTTITTLTNGRDIVIKAALAVNATGTSTNTGFRLRLLNNTGGLEGESLYMFRDLPTVNNVGNIIIQNIFQNKTLADYTAIIDGLSTSANNVDVIGGVIIAEIASNIPTVQTNLTCTEIHASKTEFKLKENQITTGTCFNISAANVTIDCQNFTVTGNNASASFGTFSSSDGTTIKNCVFHSFETGIGLIANNASINFNNYTTTFWINNTGNNSDFNGTSNGNIYNFINGTESWVIYNITDKNPPIWARNGTDRPFNSSLGGGEWVGKGNDYYPWTNELTNFTPIISYPSDGSTLGMQISDCNLTVNIKTNDAENSTATRNATVNLFSKDFNASSVFILLESKFTNNVNNSFIFKIPANFENTSLRLNGTATVENISSNMDNVDITIIGTTFCTGGEDAELVDDGLLIFSLMIILTLLLFVYNGESTEEVEYGED